MYRINCDGYPLLDLRDDDLIVVNPKCSLEVNKVGEAKFTIYQNHPYYDKLKKFKSIVEISDEFGTLFRGRMTNDTKDFYNGKAVDLEGSMAFFNDSIIRPFNFPEDFETDEDYIEASENGNVVEFFLSWIISQHNSQVEKFQRLKLGKVTVRDENNYITRENSSIASSWATIRSKLFESSLGGYICARYEPDGTYVDYVSKFEYTNTQDIVFGENLLNLNHNSDGRTTYSAIIPLGAELETDADISIDESGTKKIKKTRLTISTIEDGEITSDIVKDGDVLYSKSAVEEYGYIVAPVSDTTWEDVGNAQNLLSKGINYLSGTAVMLQEKMEITAADLHFTDEEVRSFRIYRNIVVMSDYHGIIDSYELTKLDIDLLNPQNTKIIIGDTKNTLTQKDNNHKNDIANRVDKIEQDIYEQVTNTTQLKNTVIEQETAIIKNCEQLVLSALEKCTETDAFAKFERELKASLSVESQGIVGKIEEIEQSIKDVDGDLQQKYNTILKYFTFDINGLTIGEKDSLFKVQIDNDEINMLVNNVSALTLDPDGKSLIPELWVTENFSLFGYMIEESDELVNCEYVGGE